MKSWLSWRLWVASIALAAAFSWLLFWSTGQQLTLSGLDLFFVVTTLVSLAFNLWQLLRDRFKYEPVRDSMIGLFNDLKSRQLRAYARQGLITSEPGMGLDVEAVRLEFCDFVQETLQGLDQLREHVVAVIHTLDPDVSNQQVFRASEFGLTEQEKAQRQQWMEQTSAEAQEARTSGHPSTQQAMEQT